MKWFVDFFPYTTLTPEKWSPSLRVRDNIALHSIESSNLASFSALLERLTNWLSSAQLKILGFVGAVVLTKKSVYTQMQVDLTMLTIQMLLRTMGCNERKYGREFILISCPLPRNFDQIGEEKTTHRFSAHYSCKVGLESSVMYENTPHGH